MENTPLNVKSDLDLAKEYIDVNRQLRSLEAKLSKNHIGLSYIGLQQKKKEIKYFTKELSKIASLLKTRFCIRDSKDHFKVLQKCEQMCELGVLK